MTKQYPVICENGCIAMLDRPVIREDNHYLFPEGFPNLLAATHPKPGVPKLPQIEEDIKLLVNKYVSERFENSDNQAYFNEQACERDFTAGYKANRATWTDEDLWNFFSKGMEFQASGQKFPHDYFKELIQALKLLPIAVEVEMEYPTRADIEAALDKKPMFVKDGINTLEINLRLKVDANNFIQVKRWIYEE